MKTMCALLLVSVALNAQSRPKSYWYEGLWQGYDGEWTHVTRQVMALAETTPADKYQWRPEPGVRSFSEIYMHIAIANFGLLAVTGPKMPTGLNERSEAGVTEKAQVLDWLTKSFEAVRIERAKLQPR